MKDLPLLILATIIALVTSALVLIPIFTNRECDKYADKPITEARERNKL